MKSDQDPDALFERLITRFRSDPRVTTPSSGGRFGASALKVDGKIFAMLSKEELVVKLPKTRVDELVTSATARRFDPGHGRVMKEWASVAVSHRHDWDTLAEEAHEFVSSPTASRHRPQG